MARKITRDRDEARKARLAEALRENLRRRKAQARSRARGEGEAKPAGDEGDAAKRDGD